MNFTEDLRYQYDLKPTDLVIDAGGYHGKFAKTIYERYKCRVVVYEPVFFKECCEALEGTPVMVINAGLGGVDRSSVMFGVKGDMTGVFSGGPEHESSLQDVVYALEHFYDVALLKLNVEGMEFEILERLLEEKHTLARIKNIQVQFHPVVPDAEKRYEAIREGLLKTHRLTYDFPWCWQNFERL